MFRFLHLADLHFDTIFASRREATRLRLRDAVRRAFESAIDCAIQENLDAVVVAGDLFDNERLSYSTERFILKQINRLDSAAIPFLYCTGNHDPGGPLGRAARIDWPDHATVVTEQQPAIVRLVSRSGDVPVSFVLAGHDSDRVSDNLAATYPDAEGDEPYVGVLHTHLVDSESSSAHKVYAPCRLADLTSKGYAYWALGHIHLRQHLSDSPPVIYAGNIQGRTPRESGSKGGVVVSLERDGTATTSFREFGPIVWATVEVNVNEDISHLDQLARLLESKLDSTVAPTTDRMLRVILSGSSSIVAELRRPAAVEGLEESLRDVLGVLDVEINITKLSTPIDVEQFKSEPHVLGRALHMIDELSLSGGTDVSDLIGDVAVIDWKNADDDMKQELVEGLRQDLAMRMFKDS